MNLKFSIFVLSLLVFFGFAQASYAQTASAGSVQRVVYLGQEDLKEVDVQALRNAAEIMDASRPDLAGEIRKAAEIIAN